MVDAPEETATDAKPEAPEGLVCRSCNGNEWKVTETRKCFGCVRRWRTCLTPGCGRKVRSAERIEAESHPDRDAA